MQLRSLLLLAFVVLTLLGTSSAASAAPPSPAPPADPDSFEELVKSAERARFAGRWIEAAHAYAAALKLREDSLVAGRAGLLLLKLEAYDVAATHLQHAVDKPSRHASADDHVRFFQGYKQALLKVCRLNITIDRKGTRLEIDGEPTQEGKAEFWIFVAAGKHTLRVSLEGFEDEVREIDARANSEVDLSFTMRPLPPPPPVEPPEPPPIEQPPAPTSKPSQVDQDKRSSKTNGSSNGRFVLGAGAGLVLGATPSPAFGPQIFAGWRSRSWWEIGVDLRAAWSFLPVDDFADKQFSSWAVNVAPCARWRDRWSACALVQVATSAREDSSRVSVLPGFGLRGGAELVATDHLRVQGWADVAAHPFEFRFRGNTQVDRSFVSGTIGVRTVYAF